MSTELRVGHSHASLADDRTLSSLYVDPLVTMLEHLNANTASVSPNGIFEVDPNQTVTLLLDFKTNGTEVWPLVNAALEPLRRNNWLRHWDGASNAVVPGPITVVATGHAPFELVTANQTYRDIFFDAPLGELASGLYDSTNSYYASASITKAIGRTWLGYFSKSQVDMLGSQVAQAQAKDLVSRYWDTPAWPVSARDRVWDVLVSSGVGMLNVDDLSGAARWNWDWCVVAGMSLCGW